jgi:hypothetical protein
VTTRSNSNNVGYRKPPRHTRFKAGQSGNAKGRPKGAKNFATVIALELNGRVPVTENGQRKKITKLEAMVKQMVNQAASGDLKAANTVFTQTRLHEEAAPKNEGFAAFDTPEHQLVIDGIVARIRLMDETPVASSNTIVDAKAPARRRTPLDKDKP